MPKEKKLLNVKRLLQREGINVLNFGQQITQTKGWSKGRPLSRSAFSQIVNHDVWPVFSSKEELIKQGNALLREAGFSEEEIRTAWDLESPEQQPLDGEAVDQPKIREEPEEDQLPEPEMITDAALNLFKLRKDPFTHDVRGKQDVFLSEEQAWIVETMMSTSRNGEMMAVIGESGSGKTTLRRLMEDRIREEDAPILPIFPQTFDKEKLTAEGITAAIIDVVSNGTEKPKRSREAQARQIKTLLTTSSRGGNSHVLIIEEAHDLNIHTLKYLKRFWELEDGFTKLLGILLIGQPELATKLDERTNYQAREVIRRMQVVTLKPLDGVLGLRGYLAKKFKDTPHADLSGLIDDSGLEAVVDRLMLRRGGSGMEESLLFPLLVNNLMSAAMNKAANIGMPIITGDIIKEL